jgi:hypothetical protein
MLAALVELVLLRVATRTAIHIPGIDRVAVVYAIVADAGRLAYYLAAVLLALSLGAVGAALYRRGHRFAAAVVGLVLAAAVAARAGWAGTDSVDAVVVLVVVGLAIGVARHLPSGARLPLLLYAAAFTLAGTRTGGPMAVELVAASAMVALVPLALRGADRVTRRTAMAVAAVTLVTLVVSPSTPRILLLWNAGLTGALPAVVYAIGFGAVAAAMLRCWRTGRVGPAIGLGLVVAGGLGFHSTYQSGLAVLGLAVLALDLPDAGPTALPSAGREVASSR